MKKVFLLTAVALSLASCTPRQGAKPIVYQGKSAEILATIAQIAPSVQPTRISNYFSVTGITPTFVSLSAQPVTGFQILNVLGGNSANSGTITVTFTALENGGSTSVTSSTSDNGATDFINRIYIELDKKFNRISAP